MTAKYDKTLEVWTTSKKDKAISWLCALGEALFLGIITIAFAAWTIGVAIALIELVVKKIYEIVEVLKSKFKKQ